MKTLFIITTGLAGLLLLSTLICGLWIRFTPDVEESSVVFHMGIGISTVLVSIVALGLAMAQVLRPVG